ncbi:hypothetical protein [Archangium violaceum]
MDGAGQLRRRFALDEVLPGLAHAARLVEQRTLDLMEVPEESF